MPHMFFATLCSKPHKKLERPWYPSQQSITKSNSLSQNLNHTILYQFQARYSRPEIRPGNCLFDTLSERMQMNRHNAPDVFNNLVFQTPQEIRATLVHYMRQHTAHMVHYVPGDFNDYLHNMEQDGTWGRPPCPAGFCQCLPIAYICSIVR